MCIHDNSKTVGSTIGCVMIKKLLDFGWPWESRSKVKLA